VTPKYVLERVYISVTERHDTSLLMPSVQIEAKAGNAEVWG